MPAWRSHREIVEGTRAQLAHAFDGQDDRSTFLVAEDDDGLAGFAWVLIVADFYGGRDIGKVSEIATRPSSGAGRVLLHACEAWVRERGARLITLNVMVENARARSFYERNGYAPEYTMMAKALDV